MMKLSELLYELRQRKAQVAELERMLEEGEYDSDEEGLVPIRGWGYWHTPALSE